MYISTPVPKEEIIFVRKKIILRKNSFHQSYLHRPISTVSTVYQIH